MTSRDITLLNSLVDYVKDIKPYHTKIKEFLSEIYFEDSFNVNVTDNIIFNLYHQNVWTRDDIGGYQLQRLCEGISNDKTFRIPAAVWPRTSIDDNLPMQTPPGDDPAGWNNISSSTSHFLGSDFVPGEPTKYRVPFHQGSRVYVDNVLQELGVDYGIDDSRSFIRFAVAPGSTQQIKVQLFKVDRLFISYNFPFNYDVNPDYDMYGYDLTPYDSDDSDPETLYSDYFEIIIDSFQLTGCQPPVFYNSVLSRAQKAELLILGITGGMDGDTWKVTAIGPWRFKVQKNNTGQIWYANFKETFDNGEISFIIDRVWANYYLVPDNHTYDSFSIISFDNFSGALDDTDFLVDNTLITEHGVITDPNFPQHRPMEFVLKDIIDEGTSGYSGYEPTVYYPGFPIGTVTKFIDSSSSLEYYAFILSTVPPRGTYVELRIEQNGQLNPWINSSITDDMYLQVTWPTGALLDTYAPKVIPPSTTMLIHNVNIPYDTVYEEPEMVNEIVLYHNRGSLASSVVVDHDGTPLSLTTIYLIEYYDGITLPYDTICIDENRIIINLTTAQTINITLYFNSIVPTPTPTPTPTPSGTSGSLFGSGSLAIPSGVVLVSLTGQGGTGGSNPYDPGQEYIAPSGTYHPEVIEVAPIAPYLEWTVTASRSYWSSGPVTGPSIPAPTYLGQTVIAHVAYCVNDPDNMPFGEAGPWSIIEGDYEVVLNPGLPGVTGVAAYWDNPGQEYIAPSGGDYSGANTTATLNSVTNTWVGGFGGVGTSSTQTLTSTGLGQTLTYSVGAGGNLSYSYTL